MYFPQIGPSVILLGGGRGGGNHSVGRECVNKCRRRLGIRAKELSLSNKES